MNNNSDQKNKTAAQKPVKNSFDDKIGKYLTDMKELPSNSGTEKESVLAPKKPLTSLPQENKQAGGTTKKVIPEPLAYEPPKKTEVFSEEDYNNKFFSAKDILLGVTNFIVLAVLIFILTNLPQKAQEFKAERVAEIQNQLDPAVEYAGISQDLQKSKELEALFLDEAGVVEFVGSVEEVKAENPAVQKVSFASPKAIKDTMGFSGVPVIVEMSGDWDALGKGLESIQSLPYLYKPVSVEIMPSEDNPQIFDLKYGGFLYVKEASGN